MSDKSPFCSIHSPHLSKSAPPWGEKKIEIEEKDSTGREIEGLKRPMGQAGRREEREGLKGKTSIPRWANEFRHESSTCKSYKLMVI